MYRREFDSGKKSFFQRIAQKDEGAGSEFVGLIAGCNRLNTHAELIISDGRYSLRSHAFKRGDPNDDRIMELIESQKLYVGMKIRCINQTLSTTAEDGQPKNSSFVKPNSKHFLLSQVDKLRL